MELLFILMLIVWFGILMRFVEKNAREKQKKYLQEAMKEANGEISDSQVSSKRCPPHKWTYHPKTEKLTCTLCNYEAGSDFTPRNSNDNPY